MTEYEPGERPPVLQGGLGYGLVGRAGAPPDRSPWGWENRRAKLYATLGGPPWLP